MQHDEVRWAQAGEDFKRRKRIVILGSAPQAQFPDGDAIYCANSAAVAHADRLSVFETRVTVVGDHIVGRGYDPAPRERHKHALRFIEISNAPADEIIVLRYDRGEDPRYPFEKGLSELQARSRGDIRVIKPADRRDLIFRLSGKTEPIWNREIDHFAARGKLVGKLSIRWRYWRANLRRFFDSAYDPAPYFRLSTGLYCLLLAIDQHGPKADYHVAGIRLGLAAKRHEYATGDVWPTEGLPHHLLADRVMFPALAQRYRITIDEPFT